jgi:hypothetical protein
MNRQMILNYYGECTGILVVETTGRLYSQPFQPKHCVTLTSPILLLINGEHH